MAGSLVISTLNNDTGVLATQNGMTGIAKAWVNFNGTTGAVRASFNVGSVTRNSTGNYTVNFTTAMPNADYSAQMTSVDSTANVFMPKTPTYSTGTWQFSIINNGGAATDATFINVSVFSS